MNREPMAAITAQPTPYSDQHTSLGPSATHLSTANLALIAAQSLQRRSEASGHAS
jgi:hypothetical protein